jgi:hypothetical protein
MLWKYHYFVIPRRAARRGISLIPGFNEREIPRIARNDKINHLFRKLLSPRYFNYVFVAGRTIEESDVVGTSSGISMRVRVPSPSRLEISILKSAP